MTIIKQEHRVEVENGKYTFVVPSNDDRVHILRHGEPWYQPEVGQPSHALHAIMCELDAARVVMARGWGAVLVDASSALRVGGELVRYAQDVLAARRPQTERLEDIAFVIRQERGGSIPAGVADKLLAKLRTRGVDT